MEDRHRRQVLAFQSLYYVVTGLWPLVHLASFEAVTGPKADAWLVQMVGLLAVAAGFALALATARGHGRLPVTVALAAGSAIAFAAIDVRYTALGRISPVYLADAAVELGIVIGLWLTRQGAGPSDDSPEGDQAHGASSPASL